MWLVDDIVEEKIETRAIFEYSADDVQVEFVNRDVIEYHLTLSIDEAEVFGNMYMRYVEAAKKLREVRNGTQID